MSNTIKLTGALSPREKGYNEGYKDGYEKGKADALKWILTEKMLPDVGEENWPVIDYGRHHQEKDGSGRFDLWDEEELLSEIGLFKNAWRPPLKPYRGGAS